MPTGFSSNFTTKLILLFCSYNLQPTFWQINESQCQPGLPHAAQIHQSGYLNVRPHTMTLIHSWPEIYNNLSSPCNAWHLWVLSFKTRHFKINECHIYNSEWERCISLPCSQMYGTITEERGFAIFTGFGRFPSSLHIRTATRSFVWLVFWKE